MRSSGSFSSIIFAGATAVSPILLHGQGGQLQLHANESDGSYTIAAPGDTEPILRASAGVEVAGNWLKASDYPQHTVAKQEESGAPPDRAKTIPSCPIAGILAMELPLKVSTQSIPTPGQATMR
ncbi:hypothetical protein [Acidisarcina polymorpha]|uniref:hypothetical protein n=1 Tax=Acidisarcina polymorpha TaxID=2211140 RepID=UPI001F36AD00|nr:hypothetical protein [Acidisarcina polymorpha]